MARTRKQPSPKTSARRPFGQPVIAPEKARLIPFRRRAYRFYLLLPRRRQRRAIFPAADTRDLLGLLIGDFGGCTVGEIRRPTAFGGYEMQKTERPEVVFDHHSEFTVYTKPTTASTRYFKRLEVNLRRHLWKTRGIQEEQIMIERTEVWIVASRQQTVD